MGKKTLSALALVCLLAACGKSAYDSLLGTPTDPQIPAVGAWETDSRKADRGSEGSYSQRLKISKDSITAFARCEDSSGLSVVASATAKAKVEYSRIEILEDKSDSVDLKGNKCRISISRGTGTYSVSGNRLTLKLGSQYLSLNRL